MSDYKVPDDLGEDARDTTGKVAEKARNTGDDAARGAERAKEDVKSVGHRVTDALEDVIPGDSDGDVH